MFNITRVTGGPSKDATRVEPSREREDTPKKEPEEEDYSERQRRERAQAILNNYQLLMEYAVANGRSIPQTRTYFRKVALGMKADPIIKYWFSDVA
ncbi:hypothetical protein HRR83_003628 [Exophiala dermatitidis]|uniref:Uncharacterized protein n=1 Tax=Exophiala dermatitidis TaxID=5970 RepID=A0AAN6EYC0_EXODE|nr:hypothetical protein HRR75_002740 [Exophiala dermatitidis]KAJ4522407.1 hypothetical protein HRR74_002992 [Exophiala dermatitidis]KAJ4529732.1 hypothetical protein HRR73_000760 [Exophiala dermatitidis]KAJ4543102.1 hypothetical protein HRR77_005361 [Exophiala dermatitidis]KAJ4543602.1 hypothetical protein HRR76_001669 [Exophiala dermatitidis]